MVDRDDLPTETIELELDPVEYMALNYATQVAQQAIRQRAAQGIATTNDIEVADDVAEMVDGATSEDFQQAVDEAAIEDLSKMPGMDKETLKQEFGLGGDGGAETAADEPADGGVDIDIE